MKKRVICQLSSFSPEYPGSFVDSLLQLARTCRQTLQLETLCVFPDRARPRQWLAKFDQEHVSYAFVPGSRNIVASLRQVLNGFEPVLFHSHFSRFDLAALFVRLAFYREANVVWHFHSMAHLTAPQRIKDAIKVKLLGRHFCDLFITDGKGVYDNAISRGVPEQKLLLTLLGVDLARFSSNAAARLCSRSSLGVQREQVVFLAVGRSPVIKGTDLFVKAGEYTERTTTGESLFLIIGTPATKAFVFRLAESARMSTGLRIVEPTDDFAGLLAGIDVFVAPSRTEGFPYAIIEAMAAGKLILSSDLPGIRETYGELAGVWLFPSEDWKKLAELMQRATKLSRTQREDLGQANARYVAEHLSVELWATKIAAAYSGLLNRAISREDADRP